MSEQGGLFRIVATGVIFGSIWASVVPSIGGELVGHRVSTEGQLAMLPFGSRAYSLAEKGGSLPGATHRESPDNWTYPAVLDVYTVHPDWPPLDPDSGFRFDLYRKIGDLRREILSKTAADFRNNSSENANGIQDLRAQLDQGVRSFNELEIQRQQAILAREKLTRQLSAQELLSELSARSDVLVLESQEWLGHLRVIALSKDAGIWLHTHRLVGNIHSWASSAPATVLLKFATPTVRADNLQERTWDGDGANVGVVDVGIRSTHVNLNVVRAKSFDPGPVGTHGTQVAGVVNSDHIPITGAAPHAGLWDMKAGSSDSITCSGTQSSLGFLGQNGVKLAVGSFGSVDSMSAGCFQAVADWFSWRHNLLFSNPTGNSGVAPPESPCRAFNNVCVSGSDDRKTIERADDIFWSSSNFGPTSDGRKKPDVSSPATPIMTTDSCSDTCFTMTVSGTSFAAPMVAGTAADLVELVDQVVQDPTAKDARILKASIIEAAEDKRDLGEWDSRWGWGYLDAELAGAILRSGAYDFTEVHNGETVLIALVDYRQGDTISGTITWQLKGDPTCCTFTGLADIDLRVRGPDGAIVASSTSTADSVEHLSVAAPLTGVYSWEIVGFNVPPSVSPASVAWVFDPQFAIGRVTQVRIEV